MRFLPMLAGCLYLSLLHLASGLRAEHYLFVSLILIGFYAHPRSRRLIIDLLPFALFGAVYDLLRIFPKELAGPIHVVWPHRLEEILFGLPTDFFREFHLPILDIVAAAAYSLHMIVPIAFLLWIRTKDRDLARRYGHSFLVVNLMAFLTYLFLPVAPPWYVEQHGLGPATWSVLGDAAGLVHFDEWIGFPYFQGIYSRSAWVFGAIPSMHAGFPILTLLYARKVTRWGLVPLGLFLVTVWFSAVYLRHHYVIDLLAGALYVFAGTLLYERTLCLISSRRADGHSVSQDDAPGGDGCDPRLRPADL